MRLLDFRPGARFGEGEVTETFLDIRYLELPLVVE